MTKLNHERRGPPRPRSSKMDHPRGVERPYVRQTDADRERKAAERADRKRELEFNSRARDLERTLGRKQAEAIASILTGHTPKRASQTG